MSEVIRRTVLLFVLLVVAVALDLLAFLAAAAWVWIMS
jgi:hypothetical protein